MGWYSSLKNRMGFRAGPEPTSDFWYNSIGQRSSSGTMVTPERSLQVSAVMGCVKVLSETMASLPVMMYERGADGSKKKRQDLPLYNLLHRVPNSWQTSFEYWEWVMACMCLRGNAYSFKPFSGRGVTGELVPIHPDRVRVEVTDSGRIMYIVRDGLAGREDRYGQEEIFHIRGLSLDGLIGVSPIQYARNTIGLASDAEEYGAGLFGNRAQPGGILKSPTALNETQKQALRESWSVQSQRGHGTAVLTNGMEWQQLGLTNEDAQFLETRKYQRSEIASIYRVPPHLIADLERATFSNIEHQDIGFAKHTIRPWCVRIEQAIWRDLIGDERYYVEFLIDGLMRGDIASRYSAYQIAVAQGGWLSRNEVRALENMDPVDGLDTYLEPVAQAQSAETMGNDSPEPVTPDVPDDEEDDDTQATVTLGTDIVSVSSPAIDPHAAIAPVLQDACARVASHYDRTWPKCDDKHIGYVQKTFAPIGQAWLSLTGRHATWEHLNAEAWAAIVAQYHVADYQTRLANAATEDMTCVTTAA